jgi:hypothetical protein
MKKLIELMLYPGNGGTAVFFVIAIALAAAGIVAAVSGW